MGQGTSTNPEPRQEVNENPYRGGLGYSTVSGSTSCEINDVELKKNRLNFDEIVI